MNDILGDLFFIIIGSIFALKYKWLARISVNFYDKLLGHRFSETRFRIGFLLVGIFFVISGVLSIISR